MSIVKLKDFAAKQEELNEILDYIEVQLEGLGVGEEKRKKNRFQAEDILVALIQLADRGSVIKVRVQKIFGNASVHLSCKGNKFEYKENLKDLFGGEIDEENEAIIRANLLSNYQKDVHVSYRNSFNRISIDVVKRKNRQLHISAAAMALGVLCGFLIKAFFPEDAAQFMAESVFGVGTTMFLNAIKMTIPFLVFFSIASGISNFKNLNELGKIVINVEGLFAITSILTILLTYLVYCLIPIGDQSLLSAVDSSQQVETMDGNITLSGMLENIIPDNYLGPFVNMDMLQLLFVAIITGIGISSMGEKGLVLHNSVSLMDTLFQKITIMIVTFMPVCIFFSLASMIIKLNFKDMGHVVGWMGLIYLCDVLVIMMLLGLAFVFRGTSPVWLLRQIGQVMLTSFAVASSNAVMPMTMQACGEKLGISPKIYTFSIPMGIVVNMDGGCVTLLVSALFMAKVYGVQLSMSMLIMLFVSVFILSVAAPATPGGILLCLTALLPQIGVPEVGVTIIIGLYFVVSMMQTMTNVTGTIISSYIADRQKHRY